MPLLGGGTIYLRKLDSDSPTTTLWKMISQYVGENDLTSTTDHGTGGSVTRQIVPFTNGAGGGTSIPAVGSAPTNRGWRVDPADLGAGPNFVRTIQSGGWSFWGRVAASTAQLSAQTTVTAILFKNTTEIGRGSVAVTALIAPNGGAFQLVISGVAAQTFNLETDYIQIEFYVTAPGVAVVGQTISFKVGHSPLTDGAEAAIVMPGVIKSTVSKAGGGQDIGVAGGPKLATVGKAGGGLQPVSFGGSPKSVVYSALAGGQQNASAGGGSRIVTSARAGGGIGPQVGGATKLVSALKGANGGVSPGVGGASKRITTIKSGGSAENTVGGGPGRVTITRTAGAFALMSAGGPRLVTAARSGGGIGPRVGGGSRLVSLIKPLSGALAALVGGGSRSTSITKLGGGRQDASWGGGPRTVTKSGVGGSSGLMSAGAAKIVAVGKSGGSLTPPVGGGTRLVEIGKIGGSLAASVAGGFANVVKATSGGSLAILSSGGQKSVQKTAEGGADTAGSGSAAYGVYTFGIGGVTYDATGAVVAGARLDLFLTSTQGHVGSTTSDATGYYNFQTTSEQVAHFVRGQKDDANGPGVDWFGTTDDDLLPESTRIQGTL